MIPGAEPNFPSAIENERVMPSVFFENASGGIFYGVEGRSFKIVIKSMDKRVCLICFGV